MKLYYNGEFVEEVSADCVLYEIEDERFWDMTTPCKFCGRQTSMLGTRRCDSCWESEKGLDYFINLEKGRKHVLDLLGFPKKRVIGPQKSPKNKGRKKCH